MQLEQLRHDVWEANLTLPKEGLVMWTSGNASARDPETNLVVIKPSGFQFKDLTPENLVVVDLDGNVVEGDLKPSVDTTSHLYVYRHRPDIHGIVHTHSPYATSFALRGEPLPIYTTTAAAYFGGTVPVSDFATIGEEEIGKQIVEKVKDNHAILMRNHGVFTIGKSVEVALKSAIYLEETAEVTHFSLLRGQITPLPEELVQYARKFFLESYGQG